MGEEPTGPTNARAKRRRVTIRDVARLSGVSTATVTRALTGNPRISEATRARVVLAAEQLRYQPDSLARALATGASKTFGLLLPSSEDTFWAEVVSGVEQRADARGFSVLFALSHGDPERERRMLEVFAEKRVEGVIIAAATGAHAQPIAGGIPVVLLGWDAVEQPEAFATACRVPVHEAVAAAVGTMAQGNWLAHVSVDDVAGAYAAARHLLELGHRRIGLVAGAPLRPAILRLLGYRLALEEAGLRSGPVVTCEESLEGGRRGAEDALAADPRPTALMAYNDVVAIGAMRGARALGLRIPEDVSIVGFDDIQLAGYVDPPLTTVAQPKPEMGALAVDLLLQEPEGDRSPRRHALPGTLVVRASTIAA